MGQLQLMKIGKAEFVKLQYNDHEKIVKDILEKKLPMITYLDINNK